MPVDAQLVFPGGGESIEVKNDCQTAVIHPIGSHPTMFIGIFIFWQLGAMSYLDKHYDLSRVSMTGASAGAITIVCAASKVDYDEFVEKMITKCEEIKVWERRLGVIGVLGEIARDTLERTLPEDSHKKVNGAQISVLIQPVNPFESLEKVSNFPSRASIITALSASAHIPFLVNGQTHAKFRGKSYIDGDTFAGEADFLNAELTDVPWLRFHHAEDPSMKDMGLIDCVVTPTKKRIWELFYQGQAYAKHRESLGDLACLTAINQGGRRTPQNLRRQPCHLHQVSDSLPPSRLDISEGKVKAFSRNTIYRGAFVVGLSCLTIVLVILWTCAHYMASQSLIPLIMHHPQGVTYRYSRQRWQHVQTVHPHLNLSSTKSCQVVPHPQEIQEG